MGGAASIGVSGSLAVAGSIAKHLRSLVQSCEPLALQVQDPKTDPKGKNPSQVVQFLGESVQFLAGKAS